MCVGLCTGFCFRDDGEANKLRPEVILEKIKGPSHF